ncbi:MAG: aminotransferase class I/II-fold pyridoxal phosphate-dependent enzyme [Spirochaetaceae bacterium]|nr:aminotransferase class I/II-fold pyridoxal phosphate-dependent enzyme [Spirochaetaceae bacterium]
MKYFDSDYLEGCAPEILEALQKSNFDQTPGYGKDSYCESAKEKIKAACKCKDADIWFLVGGTQANSTVLDALLKVGEGVISCDTGHIAGHEAGAVEAFGHKVITLPHENGKLSAKKVKNYLVNFYEDSSFDHIVPPGAVYISHPTEYGTLYTKKELEDLHDVCKEYKIPLFLDGARLGYGLATPETDVTLPVLAKNTDAFYIGGTKVGAMFGEAVVFPKKNTVNRFFTTIKRHGALLAKGRMLGIQFDTLFTDDLYFKLAKNAIDNAIYLKEELAKKGYKFFIDSPTNQTFVILDNEKVKELQKTVSFSLWEPYDDSNTVVRFATSWATKKEDVDFLLSLL